LGYEALMAETREFLDAMGQDIVREAGRKRFVRGALHHGDDLCAEAEGLFVVLREGQD
jgi:hypothetical protein